MRQYACSELARFSDWFEEFIADEWDRQIADDAATGRLDKLLSDVDKEIEAGRLRELP